MFCPLRIGVTIGPTVKCPHLSLHIMTLSQEASLYSVYTQAESRGAISKR